jgi:hypothetical protein
MPAQFWEAVLNSPGLGAGANYTNSTTITDVSAAPQLQLPANFLYTGQSLRLTAFGTYQTSATTPTLVLGFYYGGVAGVALAASAAVTVSNTATVNWPWRLEATATVRSVGSSGTIVAQGFLDIATSLTAVTHAPIPATALATVTIDTTAAKALTVGATWGTAASTNILVCHQFLVEAMN